MIKIASNLARWVFCMITLLAITASCYVLWNRAYVSGPNALAILGGTVACIGVIASWRDA